MLDPLSASLLPALADVLEETLDDLRAEQDPRRAVIAAYARMERALAAYGLPRNPSEAPDEYLQRIFADLEVSRRRHVALDGTVLLGQVLRTRCGAGDEAGGNRGAARPCARSSVRRRFSPSTSALPLSPSGASGRRAPDAPRLACRPSCLRSRRSGSSSRSWSRRERATLAIHIWLLVVLGLAFLAFMRLVQAAYPRTPSPFDGEPPASGRSPPSGRARSTRLEREVSMAGSAAFDVHYRLRPSIVELAAGLLSSRRGIDLEREPDRAQAALGDDVWELVGPTGRSRRSATARASTRHASAAS